MPCSIYFDPCCYLSESDSVGRILLCTFERRQYAEVWKVWGEGKGEREEKSAGDVYSVEHLCRLLSKLP